MKIFPFSLLMLSLLGSMAHAQVTTEPVGVTTISVAGNGGSGQPTRTFATLGMSRYVAFESTITSAGGSTHLVDIHAKWTDNAYNGPNGLVHYFVEVTSGVGAGTTYDINATTAANQSLTLSEPLLAGVVAGDSYRIRPHWTLASAFGETNSNGLLGGDSSTADQILLLNNLTQNLSTYYYQTSGIGGIGWRKAGAPMTDASTTVIYPDEGFIILRKQKADTKVTITGAVKTGPSYIPVPTGYNLLGNVYATSMTLASSGLYTGDSATGLGGGTRNTADQILIWNPATTSLDAYYYQTSGLGGIGWRKSGAPALDASMTLIPAGAALIVNRRTSGAGFNWVASQHPANFN